MADSIRLRTTFIGATDTHGEKVRIVGPRGQRTYSYDYGVYDMHDKAVINYMEGTVSQEDLFELPHPRRTLTRSGRGYTYLIPSDEDVREPSKADEEGWDAREDWHRS